MPSTLTALPRCIWQRYMATFKLLKKKVELNADVNLKVDGKDAADLAQMKKETNIEKYPKLIRILPQGDSESQLVESQSA